jgi:hypothetical protein
MGLSVSLRAASAGTVDLQKSAPHAGSLYASKSFPCHLT